MVNGFAHVHGTISAVRISGKDTFEEEMETGKPTTCSEVSVW